MLVASFVLAGLELSRQKSAKGFLFFVAVCLLVSLAAEGTYGSFPWQYELAIYGYFFSLMTVVAQLIRVCEPSRRENETT